MIKKSTLIFYCLTVTLLVGAFTVWRAYKPTAQTGGKTVTVNIDHLNGDDTSYTICTEEEYLRGVLEQEALVSGPETEYGLWVQTLDGETADDTLQQWWGYDVNGEMALYGVDEQVVTDGDVYDFTLNVGW